jgi:hypothetical protein
MAAAHTPTEYTMTNGVSVELKSRGVATNVSQDIIRELRTSALKKNRYRQVLAGSTRSRTS